MTLTSSKLEPNLVLRNHFVPRESCLCLKSLIVLNDTTDFKFMYFFAYCLCFSTRSDTFAIRFGTYTNGTSQITSPPPSSRFVCAHLSHNVLAYYRFGEGTLLPFTGNGNAQCLQPPIEVSFV